MEDIRWLSIVLLAFRLACLFQEINYKERGGSKKGKATIGKENVSASVADFQIGRPGVEADNG